MVARWHAIAHFLCPQPMQWHALSKSTVLCAKSCGLGQARPKPSCEWQLWLGLKFQQAKARAFGPSQAGTSLGLSASPSRHKSK